VLATAAIDAGVAFAPASPRIVRVTLSRSAPDRSVRVSWPRPVRDGPEQRPLGVAAQAEPVEIGGQVLFKIMVVSFLPKT
jgi:hypothetical protein